jgi:hypothetical protein
MTMLSEAGSVTPPISEQEWIRILRRIEDHMVIPVIGEHLTTMKRADSSQELGLAAYLGTELGLGGEPPRSLNDLAFRYLQENPRGIEDLYVAIYDALRTAKDFPLPIPLKQLAEIRDFNVFVTTSFDPYLAIALNEVRFNNRLSGSTRVLAYERNREVDIPEKYKELDYPVVYHLFGRAQAAPLFAVTDEDVLEFMHTLQAPECQPPHLSEALRDQRLLILGTRLTGWLTRFFLRVSSAERLSKARRADYLVDDSANADREQALFFEHFGEVKVLPITATSFIDELSRRWRARHPEVGAAPTSPGTSVVPPTAGEVFISYASEDLAVATKLRERLEREAGVRVWLDREALRGGDQWERRIADTLKSCAVCVPVISANVKSGSFRYVRVEWQEALRLRSGKRADADFVLPLVADDTRPDDPALDPEIRALHWRRLQDAEDMSRFISDVQTSVHRSRPQ